jgi:hypothetical protein
LGERLAAYPGLTAVRLWRELRERGYGGGYSAVRDRVRDLRPPRAPGFEVRFETPPGEQAQVDFAHFEVAFTDQPGVKRIVWLFSLAPYRTVLKLERRVSHEGMVSVGGNLYSVPDTTRRRILDVHVLADAIRIFEDGMLVASHAPLEGRDQKRLDPAHRKPMPPPRRTPADREPIVIRRAGDRVARRSLDFYDAVGRRLAGRAGGR